MQCVILAAGKGTRMRPLSQNCPKPLIPVLGKPIVEHIIDALPREIEEIIFVIGYKGAQIKRRFGESFAGRKVRYVWQKELLGTAHALRLAQPILRGSFLVLCGDDLVGKKDLKKGVRHELCVFAATHQHPEKFGVITENADGTLADIVEKPANPPSSLVSTGAMVLDKRIFNYKATRHDKGEYFLPALISQLAREYPVRVIHQDFWIPIGTPQDVSAAENIPHLKKSTDIL